MWNSIDQIPSSMARVLCLTQTIYSGKTSMDIVCAYYSNGRDAKDGKEYIQPGFYEDIDHAFIFIESTNTKILGWISKESLFPLRSYQEKAIREANRPVLIKVNSKQDLLDYLND